MTNLVASVVVTVVTNVAEIPATKIVPDSCPLMGTGSNFGCLVAHWKTVPDPDAKEKTVNTKCIEKTVLTFAWNGAREIVSERVLWESNQVMKLEWVTK